MWFVIFKEWLREQIEKRNLTYEELADLSGISKSYLSIVMSGKREATRNFCVSIAKGLGLDEAYVLSKAGLIASETLDDSTQELLEAVKKLTDDKRKTVLRFAKFLSKEPD